jgi:hypothetical protein
VEFMYYVIASKSLGMLVGIEGYYFQAEIKARLSPGSPSLSFRISLSLDTHFCIFFNFVLVFLKLSIIIDYVIKWHFEERKTDLLEKKYN